MRGAWGIALGLVGILLTGVGGGAAQATPTGTPDPPGLIDHMDAAVAATATADPGDGLATAGEQGLDTKGRMVEIEVLTRRMHPAAERVLALGGIVTTAAPGILEARVPPSSLAELGRAGAVRRLQAPWPRALDAVAGQGVTVTGAATAHAAGVLGTGVKVAIIDGGFGGLAARQASGDLPANVVTQSFCPSFTGITHGTAVAEIVHEMAPGAALYLVCTEGSADLAAAESFVAAEGVQVVNHSASYFNSSRGDGSGGPGTPDATVERARDDGILWANSSGNRGRRHWGGVFDPGPDSDDVHDWIDADERNGFTNSGQTCVALKWDSWPVTSVNLDLFLFDGAVPVASSTTVQDGDDPPIETACVAGAGEIGVEVRRVGTTATPRIDAFITGTPNFEHQVDATSVTEPGSAPEAVATGAYCFANDALEPFSSQGPSIDGRLKPDIAGPDRVSNATFGNFASCSSGGFAGTSASAPHLAGAAALLLQGSSATPAQVEAGLAGSASDLGPAGPDNQFGAGGISLRNGQPDLRLGSEKLTVKAGRRSSVDLVIENEGPLAGPMLLSGPRRRPGLSFKYLFEGVDVTADVAGAGFAREVPFGGSANLTVNVRAKRRAKGKRFANMFAVNAAEPSLGVTTPLEVKIRKRKRRR